MRQPQKTACLHALGLFLAVVGVVQCTSNDTKCWAGAAGFITDFTLPWQVQADRSRLQTTEDKIYFIYGAGAPVVAPSIWRSNVDGTEKEIFACRSGCAMQLPQLVFPKLLVLDPVGGYVYWWDTQAYYIARAKMNGTGAPEMLVCAQFGVCQRQVAGLEIVSSIVVDSQKTKRIYWTSQNMIASAPLIGDGPVTKIVCDAADCAAKMNLASPHTLRIDTATVGNGTPFLYWLSFRLVMRVRTDGTELTGLACHVTVSEVPNCKFTRNDVFDPKLLTFDFGGSPPSAYWADAASNRMFRLNTDLSSLNVIACQNGAGCGKVPPGGYNDVSFLYVGIGSVLHWIDSGPISGIDMSAGRLITADADGSNAKTLLCGPAAGCYPPTPRYARWQSTGAVTADISPPLGQGSAGMTPLMGITIATSDSSVTHLDLTVPLTTPLGFKQALFEPAFSGTGQIDGLVVRPSAMGGGVVWTVAGRVVGMGDATCSMDGSFTKSPPTQLVCAVGCATAAPQNVGDPSGITFDVADNGEGYMYWTDSLRRAVVRSNAQGTNITVLACRSDDPTCTRKVENLQAPSDIQIDRVSGYGQYLFLMDRNPFSRIIRVDITGNESPVVLTCPQHCGVGGCGGCLYPSEHVSIIQELHLDVRGGKTNSPPMLYWIDRGLDRVMRMPGDGTAAPTPVACASGCGNGLDIGYGFIVDSHDFVIDWESTPARAYFVKEAYPPQISRITLPQRNGTPASNGPEPIAVVCGSENSNSACRQRVNGDIVPFGLTMVTADGQIWLYYGALRGADRGPPTVIMRQLVRSSMGASVTGTPEVVVCSKYKYCKNVVPQLYGLTNIVARQNAVSKKWELWWGNAYSPESAYAEQGEYGIFRSNLDGTNATIVSRGTSLIPGYCQPCVPGRDSLCTSPASDAFCTQNCTAGINDPANCPASKCSCNGAWQQCRPCQVGVDAGCTQDGTSKRFCTEQCAAGGRRYGGKCTPAVCMCEEGYGS